MDEAYRIGAEDVSKICGRWRDRHRDRRCRGAGLCEWCLASARGYVESEDALMVAVILFRNCPSFGLGMGWSTRMIDLPTSLTISAFCIVVV